MGFSRDELDTYIKDMWDRIHQDYIHDHPCDHCYWNSKRRYGKRKRYRKRIWRCNWQIFSTPDEVIKDDNGIVIAAVYKPGGKRKPPYHKRKPPPWLTEDIGNLPRWKCLHYRYWEKFCDEFLQPLFRGKYEKDNL